ncbi:hypothetical protein BSR29_03700 [Boudabousia liubingyangii]|uniref:UvrD-like helicase ATP-binding domain-containing protein n=1 Tax=Boudabousia liubingyangii TaxID=1921764 RepID=A0A1Q5PN51_9ACTO|nr:UvrD-helicase domain-containing protein [Boudabousia liubingyangii]OKL48956.1 hypothetical protein BSR29_03700 [Boudabousia liubingyangii]
MATPTSPSDAQLQVEQRAVDHAYEVLDVTRRRYRERQARAHASGGSGSHQARTERDAISSHFGDEAARLEQLEERLVFGKLTGLDGSIRYIGRTGLVDEDDQRVLMDWRAPAALPFYQATAVEPLGVAIRRHIMTRLRQVISVEDDLLDTKNSEASELQGEGALMAALSSARSSFMGDIVATIQAEQDRVIRSADQGILVVQGGPGTGKTAVALHRAAYLLYAEHKRLARSGVLIVGPSNTFLRYIEKVLPSLGETGVVSLTPQALVPGFKASTVDPVPVAKLKGDLLWERIINRAVRGLERTPKKPVEIRVNERILKLMPEDFKAAITRGRRASSKHNEGWQTYATYLLDILTTQLSEQAEADSAEYDWARDDLRSLPQVRKAINWHWLPATPQQLLSRLFADPERLARFAPELSAAQRELLVRPMNAPWTDADVALIDEAAEQLGEHPQVTRMLQAQEAAQRDELLSGAQRALETGFDTSGLVSAEALADLLAGPAALSSTAARAAADRSWTYGHVVVDEAQELSPMQWRALLRRCPSRSFTVVGDLDQQRIDHGPATWEQVLGPAAHALQEQVVLETSYRTPATIMDAAQRVMEALGRTTQYPVKAVRDIPDALIVSEPVSQVEELMAAVPAAVARALARFADLSQSGLGRVVVIAPEEMISPLKDLLGPDLDERVWITRAAQTKGLEFDSTILLDPVTIGKRSLGDLFVALTRSTQTLEVLELGSVLPGLRTS